VSELVAIPARAHACPVRGGHWTTTVPLDPSAFPGLTPGAERLDTIHQHDRPGTIRACDCGRTWVAYRPAAASSGQAWAPGIVMWAAEGRIARWLRVRRSRA
jgi:hypothetical protein